MRTIMYSILCHFFGHFSNHFINFPHCIAHCLMPSEIHKYFNTSPMKFPIITMSLLVLSAPVMLKIRGVNFMCKNSSSLSLAIFPLSMISVIFTIIQNSLPVSLVILLFSIILVTIIGCPPITAPIPWYRSFQLIVIEHIYFVHMSQLLARLSCHSPHIFASE